MGVQILKCLDLGRSDLRSWVLGSSDLGSRMLRSQIFRFLEARMLRSQILDAGKLRSWMLGCRAEAGHLWEGEFKPTAACKCKITRAASPWDGIWRLLGGQNLWSKARGRLGLWRTLSRGCRCAGTSRQRSQELSQLLHVTAALCVCCSRPPRAAARPSGGEISRVLSLSGQLTLGVEQNPALLPLQSPAEGSGREQGGIKTAMGVNSRIPPSTTCRCWEGKHPECVFFSRCL